MVFWIGHVLVHNWQKNRFHSNNIIVVMNIINIIYQIKYNISAPKLNQRVILMKAISLLVHTKMYITMRTLYSTSCLFPALGRPCFADAGRIQCNQVCWLQIQASGQEQDSVYPTGSALQRFFVQHAVVI